MNIGASRQSRAVGRRYATPAALARLVDGVDIDRRAALERVKGIEPSS